MKVFYLTSFYAMLFCLTMPLVLSAEGETDYIKIKNSYHLEQNNIISIHDLSIGEEGYRHSKKIRYAKAEIIYGREDKTDIAGDDWNYELYLNISGIINGVEQLIGYATLEVETGGQARYQSSIQLAIPEDVASLSFEVANVSATNGTLSGSNAALFQLQGGTELIKQILPEDVRIEFSIETEKYYYLNASQSPSLNVSATTLNYTTSGDHTVDLFWNYIYGAEEYEIQIGFVDAYTIPSEVPSGLAVFDNSISITTTNTWYSPEIIYPEGTVYFRVRPIGRYIYGVSVYDERKVKPGAWSAMHSLAITVDFEGDYNWQLSQTFAEDGKRKSVMSYFDQSLRSRQVQTNLSTDEATLVAESKYDFEGRPAVSILPTPAIDGNVLTNDLFYKGKEIDNNYSGVNRNTLSTSYEKVDFDKTGFADELGTGIGEGAAGYFSSNNLLTNIHTDLIPNAQGYPITQTRYSRDGTGRVAAQGGVGPQFQIGEGHDTKYYYTSANETELKRLFGSNVGPAENYKKNLVVDANGQVSVSYLDMAGRVIATALSGETPDELEAIYDITAALTKVNLDDRHQVDLENRVSTLDYTFAFPEAIPEGDADDYDFSYKLDGVIQMIGGTECEACVYKLTLKVIDPDGIVMAEETGSTVGISTTGIELDGNNICDNPSPPATYPEELHLVVKPFKAGEYRVVKKLELLTPPYDITDLIAAGEIIDAQSELILYLENNPINPLECIVNCEQCESLLTIYDGHPNVVDWYNECIATKCPCESCGDLIGQAAQNACYTECAATQAEEESFYEEQRCSSMYYQMRADVNEGGWMFELDIWLNAVRIIESSLNPNGPIAAFSNIDDLRAAWEDDWADILVVYHREYCHYEFCSDASDFDYNSDRFNRSLQRASQTWPSDITWLEIEANLNNFNFHPLYNLSGFVDVDVNGVTFIDWHGIDPFFINLPNGNSLHEEMDDYIETDFNTDGVTDNGLLDFLDTYNGNSSDPLPASWTPLEKWNILVGSYLNAKGKIRDEYIENELDCSFYDDDKAIVSRFNPIPLDAEEAEDYVSGELSTHCQDLCEGNVANWMYYLEQQCPAAFTNPANEGQLAQIKGLLQYYCQTGCEGGVNPYGIISDQIAGNSNLSDLWGVLIEAETLVDNVFSNNSCTADGILDGTGSVTDDFDTGITYTYEEIVDIPGASEIDHCEPCEVLANFIDFGEWVLVDEQNGTYTWEEGHWDLAGLNDYLLASPTYTGYYITPFHVVDMISTCNAQGYSFHGEDEFCTIYGDNIYAYFSNFLGCPGMWSIYGYETGAGTSICDVPQDGLGLSIIQNVLDEIENCGTTITQYYWNAFDGASNTQEQEEVVDEFNEAYNTNLSMAYFENILDLYHLPCTPPTDFYCEWPDVTNENLYTDIDRLPCDPYSIIVIEVTIPDVSPPLYNEEAFTECIDNLTNQVTFDFNEFYNDQIDDALTELNQLRVDNCFSEANGFKENLTYEYTDLEYQYTLYYYDQAGNLIQTVPPEGVDRLGASDFTDDGVWKGYGNSNHEPNHTRVTRYQYNSLNQVESQSTPETRHNTAIYGSEFAYDDLGRIRISQDAEQKFIDGPNDVIKYSYTKYDDLGRITEVGQLENYNNGTIENLRILANNDPNFPNANYTLGDVIKTYYDEAGPYISLNQENLRNRVSYTENDDVLTEYSYDAHGNVKILAHELKDPTVPGHQRRYGIEYNYDLISGNVNEVIFKPGVTGTKIYKKAVFHHKYEYDADNRLTHVHTSKDGVVWNNDARYFYYLHGPLARIELGEDKVQGLDYYYSLQGWIKGVNNPYDGDFSDDGTGNEENHLFAKDAMAYRLGYFYNDYRPINNLSLGGGQLYFDPPSGSGDLFNGNISAMETYIPHFNSQSFPNDGLQKRDFIYDQLHRIKTSIAASGTDLYSGTGDTDPDFTASGPSYTPDNEGGTTHSYDKNGNLTFLWRAGENASPIDNLTYHYKDESSGNPDDANLLSWVDDSNTDPTQGIPAQFNSNYSYDKIGNLISDVDGKVQEIKWNVQGKVEEVKFEPGGLYDRTEFTYDAQGNRLSKINVFPTGGKSRKYYIRDASGNVMAIYTDDKNIQNVGGITQFELPLYGSSRVGVHRVSGRSILPFSPINIPPIIAYGDRGEKKYELSNHLGNVLAVVSDKKLGYSNAMPAGNIVDYYDTDIKSANDYYPFGMAMAGRTANSSDYRYGFNGKEKDENGEWGDLTHYDYGFRIYNPGIGRFLSVDPLTKDYPMLTPYQFASNRPIDGIDLDGLEYISSSTLSLIKIIDPLLGLTIEGTIKPVTYDGKIFYKVGQHYYLNKFHRGIISEDAVGPVAVRGPKLTEWIYKTITPVVEAKDNVGYSETNNCYDAACKTIEKAGYIAGYYYDKRTRQMILRPEAVGKKGVLEVTEETKSEAIDLLHRALEAGKPVLVGIDNADGAAGNFDQTTDHYVVIVGRGLDKDGEYFRYYDNTGEKTREENKLYLTPQNILRMSPKIYGDYKVSQVRPVDKKPTTTKKNEEKKK